MLAVLHQWAAVVHYQATSGVLACWRALIQRVGRFASECSKWISAPGNCASRA